MSDRTAFVNVALVTGACLAAFGAHAQTTPPQPVTWELQVVRDGQQIDSFSGTTNVGGWAFDNVAVSKVAVYVDDVLAGTATYGGSRPDVANDWPHAPSDIGYNFSLSTTSFANGAHNVEVRATDTSGNVAVFPDVPVTIQN